MKLKFDYGNLLIQRIQIRLTFDLLQGFRMTATLMIYFVCFIGMRDIIYFMKLKNQTDIYKIRKIEWEFFKEVQPTLFVLILMKKPNDLYLTYLEEMGLIDAIFKKVKLTEKFHEIL